MSTAALHPALAEARRALIDLSPRNRLLALPDPGRGSSVIEFPGERAESLWRLLVLERKAMGFAAGSDEPDAAAPGVALQEGQAAKPRRTRRAAAPGATPPAADPDDLLLSTLLPAAALSRTLVRLERAARSFLDEQGITLLHLGLGTLRWADPKQPAKPRRAPLLLLPAALSRRSARDGFALRWNEAEVVANEALAVLLADQFRIALPPPPDFDERAEDGFRTARAWMEAVAQAIANQAGWQVTVDDAVLGLFGFAKLLMARDLEHPRIAASPWTACLLAGAPPPPSPAAALAEDADLDREIRVERLDHVIDADASQTRAIERARRGDSLVIQGPPGTGKSQTIANIIAQAVLDGKTVLFVAEKMAALSVVMRRLAQVGLGGACLELHSEKAGRTALLAELDRSLKRSRPPVPERHQLIARLGLLRGRLNGYARALHAPVGASGLSAYDAIGRLVLARIESPGLPEVALDAAGWTAAEITERRARVAVLAEAALALGDAATNPWRGLGVSAAATGDAARIIERIPPLLRAVGAARSTAPAAASPAALAKLLDRARAWQRFVAIQARAPGATAAAWSLPDLAGMRTAIANGGFFANLSASYRTAHATLAAAVRGFPSDKTAQLALIDALAEGQALLGENPGLSDTPGLDADALAAVERGLEAALGDFASAAGMDDAARAALRQLPFEAAAGHLAAMAADPDGLFTWSSWQRASADPGLAPLAEALAGGRLAPREAAAAFERAVAAAIWRAAGRASPELATFDALQHAHTEAEFRSLDAARMQLARAEAALAHAARTPDAAGLAVVQGEIARRRGHLPIRTLLARAAPAIQALKPVFLMSPLSVAQYLDADALGFDMLVMDEASQIEPVDAIGAIARARQIIVVGDDRQMPPTAFFRTMTSEADDASPAEPARAGDMESILSLCNARGLPGEMLRWHYRSRHQSLIKVSNDAFYGGRLLVIPSPRARSPELGLSLTHIDGGIFDSGGDGTNVVEAHAVAAAAIAHARQYPGDTLGIAAFSVGQRDAILDAVEALRRGNPDTEAFFNGHADEPFFVKNLENVQGDERDAIFVSIGYAPDRNGNFAMRFGPLSSAGGERRLNVLITRAKKRCVVFSSITAEQIDLARAGGAGVAVLKDFLTYAAAGPAGAAPDSRAEAADPLARAVQLALQREGIATRARVGLSGMFLDLAVTAADGCDLALGVALDSDFYVLASGARDRDRQRDAALAMMGWTLVRSWSPAWLTRPEAEAASLAAAARTAAGLAAPAEAAPPQPAEPVAGLAIAYAPARLEVPRETPIAEVPFARLSTLAAAVVRQESPVHQEAVVLRLCQLWGVEPDAGIRAAVQQALRLGRELEGIAETGAVWSAPDAPVAVRDRSALPPVLRRAVLVPAVEWQAALFALAEAAPGTPREQLSRGAARLLGLGSEAAPAAAAQLAMLEGEGRLVARGGGLFAA